MPLEHHDASPGSKQASSPEALYVPLLYHNDRAHSNDLISRDDWPAWLLKGVDYLQEISEEEGWVALLVSFVDLELQLGPNQYVGCRPLPHFAHLFL